MKLMATNQLGSKGNNFPVYQDAGIVAGLRLFLACAVLLADLIELPNSVPSTLTTVGIKTAYTCYSLALFVIGFRSRFAPGYQSKVWIWADVFWFCALIAASPYGSVLFWLYLFPIVFASFRHGFLEGINVTLTSAALHALIVLVPEHDALDWERILLRTVFLITLGILIAYWGGTEMIFRRRIALFKDVSLHGNLRFGVDQTIALMMARLRAHFGGDTCLIVFHDPSTDCYLSRRLDSSDQRRALQAQTLPKEIGIALLGLGETRLARQPAGLWSWLSHGSPSAVYDFAARRWLGGEEHLMEAACNLLDARSLLSAPLKTDRQVGRIFISSSTRSRLDDDLFFLYDITLAATSVIDTIDLLDRLASEAAVEERRRIVGDVHDTAIQPYIGLRMGLEALRRNMEPGHALTQPLENLISMTTTAVQDLRHYIGELKRTTAAGDAILVSGARRHAAQYKGHYGIVVTVHAEQDINVSDRLASQALQIIKEGLSNIRRHTCARSADVRIAVERGVLSLIIENERPGVPPTDFLPRSIADRAEALGGRSWISHQEPWRTLVNVEIPV